MTAAAFWAQHGHNGHKPRRETLAVRTWHMLEAQYCLQAAYTSCGWFFEDLDRIEPRNNINEARCAISHMWQALHVDLQRDFVADLTLARSWRTQKTGDMIYQQLPMPPNADMLPRLIRVVRKEPAA